MDREIAAARKSLAATAKQMNLDAGLLCMALELADDVGEVYETAEPQLRRALNQAFFKRVRIMPVFDDGTGALVRVEVVEAELTQPYKVLTQKTFTKMARSVIAWLSQKRRTTKGGPR